MAQKTLEVLSGDFRQIQPVIRRLIAADEIPLLAVNMRVVLLNDLLTEDFSKYLLNIGNRRVPVDVSSGLLRILEILSHRKMSSSTKYFRTSQGRVCVQF